MLLYIIPFVLTILSSIKYDINRKNDIWEKYGLLFLFVYLILLIGLRYKVGGDTINYMGDYDWRVPLSQYKLSFNDKFQPGYIILCSLGKSISPDFYVFQLIHSALLNTLLFLFIKNNTKYVYTSLGIIFLTCYFYFSTEILRESIAVLIFSLNYKNLINRRWLSYYTGVLLCFMFHLSAIFLVIIPFLRWIRFNAVFIFLVFIELLLVLNFRNLLINISSILSIDLINSYIDETSHGLLADLMNLLRSFIIPTTFALMIKKGLKRKMPFENMIAIFSLIGLLGFFNPIIFGRLTNYFILFFSLSIATIIVDLLRSKRYIIRNYATIIIIIIAISYGSSYIMYKRYTLWYPYCSIFSAKHIEREYLNKTLLNK